MDDPALEEIRARRLAQLMAGKGGGGGGGSGMTPEAQQQQAEARAAAEEQRSAMLAAVLEPEARDRLARIALVKPDKARGVEDMVLRMARNGQLTEKVTEDRLVGLLDQISAASGGGGRTKVTIQRRNVFDDDD